MKAPSKEIIDFHVAREAKAKSYLEQCEYEAQKDGKIFVASQGRSFTPAEYDAWFHNDDA